MTGPIHAKTADSGSRWYTDPADSSASYPSVTTIISSLDKPALPRWAAKSVAEYAVQHRDAWSALPAGDAVALLKAAPWAQRDKAAKLGSEVHAAAEAYMLGTPAPSWPDDVAPFMHAFTDWLSDFSPAFELVEATVANPGMGYAGTLDAIATVAGKRLVIDYKTGAGVYPETALQLAAYRRATEVWLPLGNKQPMPETDGAAVLHLRPEGYRFLPVHTNDQVFDAFLAAHSAHDWKVTTSKGVLCAPLPVPAVAL